MADIGYAWDEEKYDLVWRTHGITMLEAIEALEDPEAYTEEDPHGYMDRYLMVGRTKSGTVLQVIYSDAELPMVRMITAFEANEQWRKRYERR